jgi:peptidyl-prolyl cis-trans isomerase D
MLESLRNFLSGKRVIVIAILLAIPFVFFGSTSFGTSFNSFGTVNGEPVLERDVNLATRQVSQRLQSIYGEEFSLDDLEEGVSIGLIKDAIISDKLLLSEVKNLGLLVSEKKAKEEIMSQDIFQGEQGFDRTLFESTVRSGGFSPEEYIEIIQDNTSQYTLRLAMGAAAFPIEKDILSLASLLETSRDINFIKVDKSELIDSQAASLTEGQEFYEANPVLFLSQEQRDFSYIILTFDAYKQNVDVPENFIEDSYADYLEEAEQQIQNRISHLMIEKSNFNSSDEARELIQKTLVDINSGVISFNDAVTEFSDDLASKDFFGDLGLSSGDAFPEEFENAILKMQLNELSNIIELEDSFHILKLTETLKPEIKTKASMEKQLLDELIDAEALALMQDDFLALESMVLDGVTLKTLSDNANQPILITGLKSIDNVSLQGFIDYSPLDLFNNSITPNQIEIFESSDSYAFVMMTQKLDPAVQPFVDVAELSIQEVRVQKADQLLEEFSSGAEAIILGSKVLPDLKGLTQEEFKSVKRFSSLLPSEVINLIFESPIGDVQSSIAFNGDHYWAISLNETVPTKEALGDSLEQYRVFYNESIERQYSGFIDNNIKKNQNVRLENFNAN